MTALKHHPQFWLRNDAAAAFDKAEDEHGILTVNSAGRTVAEQQAFINRWNAGGTLNRPPYLYKPAMPAPASNHVKDGGIAVDVHEYAKFAAYSAAYGFIHSFPSSDPVHFDFHGLTPTGSVGFSQVTKDRQSWIMAHPGISVGPTGADGLQGPATVNGYKEYEAFLRDNGYGYAGAIDGIWGSQLQAAHQKYVNALNAAVPPVAPPPAGSTGHKATVADLMTLSDIRGFQKIARLNGGATAIDNKPGPKTIKGMQTFLNVNYKGSVALWLRAKWGYKDADDIWGPNQKAAAVRANAANFTALK